MRTRKEIETEMAPDKVGSISYGKGTEMEYAILEVLLDVRDLLTNHKPD